MTHRFYVLPLIFLTGAFLLFGCDQGSQNPDFSSGDSYIINFANSAVGDGSKTSVTVPDTLDYFVQGFTINKDYTWTVNGDELPVNDFDYPPPESHVWESREGEFISLVYSLDDPHVDVDPASGSTVDSLTVSATGDDIEPRTIAINAVIPGIGDQLARLPGGVTGGSFDQATGLAGSAGIVEFLSTGQPGGNQSYTLFAPTDAAFADLGAVPTQATDADESPLSSVRADILKYHAVASRVTSGDLSDGPVSTLFGGLDIQVDATNLEINGRASILGTDFPVLGNGVVHTIDEVLLPPTASADYTDQDTTSLSGTNGDELTVDGVFMPEGGFVVVHVVENDQPSDPIGHSSYRQPGIHNEVSVPLDAGADISSDTTLVAMPHRDTDDDQTYDFQDPTENEDGPYLLNGDPVIDFAEYTIQ